MGKADTTSARRRMQGLAMAALIAVCAGAVWFISRPKIVERNPLVEARLRVASIALIGVLESGRNPQDAIDAYARVLELDPGCLEGRKGLGIASVAAKNFHEGLKHLLAYLKKEPNDGEANLWAARGYKKELNIDLAVQFYRRACDLDRRSVEARKELAQVYLERRMPMEATSKLYEALALKDDEELRRMLTTALEMQAAMARDAETRPPLSRAPVGPELPDPLAGIKNLTPKTPKQP